MSRLVTSIAMLSFGIMTAVGSNDTCVVTFVATVPEETPPLYLAGNLEALGPWQPDGLVMTGDGRERIARLEVPIGTALEYKFTLGSWEREALGPSGMVMPNFQHKVEGSTELRHEIRSFKRPVAAYLDDWQNSGVLGTLIYWRDVASDHLEHTRNVSIWLPPGYDTDPQRRYRVLYMSDGQNLFDPRIASTGTDWAVDEALTDLVAERSIEPIIVVGVWSTASRGAEYSPWHGAPKYARFLIDELMPRVNAEFRTLIGPQQTVHIGSSMGGLLSFYLATRHPAEFGGGGCLSTHFPLSAAVAAEFMLGVEPAAELDQTPYILRDIENGLTVPPDVRLWFDYGSEGLDQAYGPTHDALREWLTRQQRVDGRDFVIRCYEGADHDEASWRARLKDPLRFLFGATKPD
jgi:enterochelin esterase-like enzyme